MPLQSLQEWIFRQSGQSCCPAGSAIGQLDSWQPYRIDSLANEFVGNGRMQNIHEYLM